MIFNLSGGGDGAGLNFTIVGGTVEPANPRENTIWVNTDTEITGWRFDTNEPAECYEGMVWIATGANSHVSFNALKKNTFMTYPTGCKQFVNGVLNNIAAKSYVDGAWVDWLTYLFTENSGQLVPWTFKVSNAKGTVSEKDGSIVFEYTTVDNNYMAAGTEGAVDLSGKSWACFDLEVRTNFTSGGGEFTIGVTSQQVNSEYNNTFVASEKPSADSTRKTIKVDVSDITTGFISMYGIVNATVYNVWLE